MATTVPMVCSKVVVASIVILQIATLMCTTTIAVLAVRTVVTK